MITQRGRFTPRERDVAGLMLALGMKPRHLSMALCRDRRTLATYVSKGRFEPAPGVQPLDLDRRHREWTEDEEVLLSELVSFGHGVGRVAEILGRPERVTMAQATKLGIGGAA